MVDRQRPSGIPIRLHRGQSEPLAALISVAAVCLAVSVYAGVVTDVVPNVGSDRSVAEPATDRIWQEISTDGIYDRETDVAATLSESSLPQGYHTAVELTVVTDDGSLSTVGSVRFDDSDRLSAVEVPDSGVQTVERPVSVRLRSGDVRPGRLTVEVWK